jgi:hypothetical protein
LRYLGAMETLSTRLTPAVKTAEVADLLRRIPDLVPSPDLEHRIVKSADRRKRASRRFVVALASSIRRLTSILR